MEKEQMQKALDAIHDEAVKLLKMGLSESVEEKVRLIVSIARHGHDLRNKTETNA